MTEARTRARALKSRAWLVGSITVIGLALLGGERVSLARFHLWRGDQLIDHVSPNGFTDSR